MTSLRNLWGPTLGSRIWLLNIGQAAGRTHRQILAGSNIEQYQQRKWSANKLNDN